MKISTLTVNQPSTPEVNNPFRKTVLLVLLISLAFTALADSVQLFNDLSSCAPYIYECKISKTSSSILAVSY